MDTSISRGIITNNVEIKSLSDYLEEVNKVVSAFFNDQSHDHASKAQSEYIREKSLWFRGHAEGGYKNLPNIYRTDTWESSEYGYHKECNLFGSFKRRSKTQRSSDFEYLHLMQHYGLPTRLLDFTESSLVALFFAIYEPEKVNNPHVWIIDPFNFNYVFQSEKFVPFMFDVPKSHDLWKYIHPKNGCEDNLPEKPIAVYPSFYDDRIVAQKSVFVLFGKDKIPLEDFKPSNPFLKIAKLTIDSKSCHNILDDLFLSGIDYHSVFPDLNGLVQQLKNEFSLKGSVIKQEKDNRMRPDDYL